MRRVSPCIIYVGNKMKRFCYFKVLLIYCFLAMGWTKMILKSATPCEPKDYLVSFNITAYFENNQQFIDGNFTLKVPLSDDLKAVFRIDLVAREKRLHVMSATEGHACSCGHKYLGEFAYDAERAASLIPGLCPIPIGKYRVHHYLLDFDKTTIRGLPLGALQGSMSLIGRNHKIVTCVLTEVDHF